MFIAPAFYSNPSPVRGGMSHVAPPELGKLTRAFIYKHPAPTERHLPLLQPPMFERPFAAAVGGDGVAVAGEEVFISREPFEADGAARVELGGADAQLRAEAVAE